MSLLEDEDDDPERRGEREDVEHHGLDREHDRAERPGEQDQRQEQDEREHVGEAAEQGVQEVAVDRGDAGQRAPVPSRLAPARSMVPWMPGAAPSIAGNASTNEFGPRRHSGGAHAPTTPGTAAQLRRDLLRVAAVLDEDVERLHHAGADLRGGELLAAGDRRAGAGEVLQLRLAGVQLRSQAREHGDDRDADGRDRDRAPEHEARPAAPGAVLGMAGVDQALRHHPDAVDPLPENGRAAPAAG